MPTTKHVHITMPDGEKIFFKSKQDCALCLGVHIETLNRAVREKRPTQQGHIVEFVDAEWKERDPVTVASVPLHTNVFLGLKAYGAKKGKAVTVLIREAIFEMLPELYLFDLGRNSSEGLKDAPFRSVGSGVGFNEYRAPTWKQPEEKIDRTK